MNCPTCVVGDLQFFVRGNLRFRTDRRGRPFGTAEIEGNEDHCWMQCDTCHAPFGIRGWPENSDVTLYELESIPQVKVNVEGGQTSGEQTS